MQHPVLVAGLHPGRLAAGEVHRRAGDDEVRELSPEPVIATMGGVCR